ncbi:Plug domain-containing protein [Sphingomonas sp. LR59]|uniref:Plug domain-containing protein n=1 Tax=Sphingomonas sp. LR59 TaxID=3050232 RepID=UPI002FE2EF48
MTKWMMGAAILAIAATTNARAQTTVTPSATPAGDPEQPRSDEIVVTGQSTAFANTRVTTAMIERQSALASVNDVINELPGVFVAEGDAFGSSDWATSISIRGFNSGGGGGQQIGSTIDGLPNGGSGYGGGSRANRYIDVLDLKTVNVSQGTADISSRSNEALGATLDYVTSDPTADSRLRFTAAGVISVRANSTYAAIPAPSRRILPPMSARRPHACATGSADRARPAATISTPRC